MQEARLVAALVCLIAGMLTLLVAILVALSAILARKVSTSEAGWLLSGVLAVLALTLVAIGGRLV